MFIEHIEVEGFKSFGSPGVSISLSPLNFLVGPNGAGKTNILSALRFLQMAVVQDVQFAVNEFGGIAEVRNRFHRQRKEPKPTRILIKGSMGATLRMGTRAPWRFNAFEYEIVLDLRSDSKMPCVESERFVAILDSGSKQETLRIDRKQSDVEIVDPLNTLGTDGSRSKRKLTVPDQDSLRLFLGIGLFVVPCVIVRQELKNWQFFNISPRIAREPAREEPDVTLGYSGEGLSVVLHRLDQSGKEELEAIANGLRGAVPGFKKLEVKRLEMENKWGFQIVEDKMRGGLNPISISDGTIRLLALLVLTTWKKGQSSLLAIEEPENGLHPHLSEYIVEILRSASKDRQVIATTHNPLFLDHLQPDEILLCDKQDGFTEVRRAGDVDNVNRFRETFQLGELWTQGALGGVP